MPELDYTPTPAELERLVSDDGGPLVYPAPPQPGTRSSVSLWDVVEGAWTAPLPAQSISLRLKKVVFQCKDCAYASVFPNDVDSHIRRVREQSGSHEDAGIESGVDPNHGTYFYCSACGAKNSLRMKVQRHIKEWQDRTDDHQQEGHRLVRRFREGPPVVLEQPPVMPTPIVNAPGPVKEQLHGNKNRKRKYPHTRHGSRGSDPAVGSGRVAEDQARVAAGTWLAGNS